MRHRSVVPRAPACGLGLLLSAVLSGCPPDPGPQPPGPGGDTAPPATSAAPETAPPADPLEGSVFNREQLFEIYRAEQAGGAERERVLRAHRLLDQGGQEVPARVKAYEAALQQYASRDPEGWAAFVETLPR